MKSIETQADLPPARFRRWLYVGPVVLFLAAVAYGILEVHSSTDTWIGLAAGRQILNSDSFPKTDTFSYTFNGQVWYNQNWLTHVIQYWLYSHVSPNAVIYGTWTLSASVFFLTLLAAYWRSRSWFGAFLAAAVVALGCRDFLSARPATTGFFCIAALWALICALEGQREKRRWWPLPLLLSLLLFWGNAHGSFIFGYGVLALYIGHWFVVRTIRARHAWLFSLVLVLGVILVGGLLWARPAAGITHPPNELLSFGNTQLVKWKLGLLFATLAGYCVYWVCIRTFKPRLAISDAQAFGIIGVIVLAFALTVALGPFGIHNFTHGNKIASSEVFRQVSEWTPPTAPGRHFPPVWRFWAILWVSVALLAIMGGMYLVFRSGPRGAASDLDDSNQPRGALHTSLFDVAVVAIGLAMTFWARRFAPIYFIFAAPVFLTWFLNLARPVPARLRFWARAAVAVGALAMTVEVVHETYTKAKFELVDTFRQGADFSLLQRVTRYDGTPYAAIRFLNKNDLHVNVLVEWTQAGAVMFYAPNAKVYMDGRAQQVYDEKHYRKYSALLGNPKTPRSILVRLLNEYPTDAVLIKLAGPARNLSITLQQSRDWIPVFLDRRYGLFLKRDSDPFRRLCNRLRRGAEWRPDDPLALASRGLVWQGMNPPNLPRAINCWRNALDRDVRTGAVCFRPLVRALISLDRVNEADQTVRRYYQVLRQRVSGMRERERRHLLKILNQCWNDVQQALTHRKTG